MSGVCSPTSVCWNETSSSVLLGHTRCCDPSGEEGDTTACPLSTQELTLRKRCAGECQVCPWRAETWRGHGCASPDGMGPHKLPATLCLYRVTAAERPVGARHSPSGPGGPRPSDGSAARPPGSAECNDCMQTPGAVLVRAARRDRRPCHAQRAVQRHLPGTHTAPVSDEHLRTIGVMPDGSQRCSPVLQKTHPKRRF